MHFRMLAEVLLDHALSGGQGRIRRAI